MTQKICKGKMCYLDLKYVHYNSLRVLNRIRVHSDVGPDENLYQRVMFFLDL
jgi:hypothetical protein